MLRETAPNLVKKYCMQTSTEVRGGQEELDAKKFSNLTSLCPEKILREKAKCTPSDLCSCSFQTVHN